MPITYPFDPIGWLPVSMTAQQRICWRPVCDSQFPESCFEDTILRLKQGNPAVQYTDPVYLMALAADRPRQDLVKPTAFIFHTSRCGSTLWTQMLATTPQNIVYAEPPLLDELLSAPFPESQKIALLRATVDILGLRRNAEAQSLFIKWDSWHLAYYPLICKAFPRAPVFLLYRNPLEILQSHHRMRGRHMVPGLLLHDLFGTADIPRYDLDAYACHVLRQLFEWSLQYVKESAAGMRLINYRTMPESLYTALQQLGVSFPATTQRQMHARAFTHSKHPDRSFAYETSQPLTDKSFNHLQEKLAILQQHYLALEGYRLKQYP